MKKSILSYLFLLCGIAVISTGCIKADTTITFDNKDNMKVETTVLFPQELMKYADSNADTSKDDLTKDIDTEANGIKIETTVQNVDSKDGVGTRKIEICKNISKAKFSKISMLIPQNSTCTNTLCISEKEMTAALRRHLLRIGLNDKLYKLVKTSLAESLKDEQNYNQNEVKRLNKEIEECTEILKKMYLDQLNKVIDMDLWINIKNEYEFKLNRLNAELQRHQKANVDYMATGMKILDICKKAGMPYSELSPEMIAQLVRQTYSSVTVNAKKVKMTFAEPFATLEKLIRLAKQGIDEYGYDEFAKTLANTKVTCLKGIKKEPIGSFESISPSSTCMKWWAAVDSNHRPHPYQGCALTT